MERCEQCFDREKLIIHLDNHHHCQRCGWTKEVLPEKQGKKIFIVMPAYNAALKIEGVYASISSAILEWVDGIIINS